MARPATAELATVAWLKTITGLENGVVATQLPKDTDSWKDNGFIVVGPDVAGAQGPYVPWRQSVMQLECYAVNPSTLNPDWATANYLAELVVDAAIGNHRLNTETATRSGYAPVRITSAWPATDPRRDRTDPSSYAKYLLDLALNWVQIGETP